MRCSGGGNGSSSEGGKPRCRNLLKQGPPLPPINGTRSHQETRVAPRALLITPRSVSKEHATGICIRRETPVLESYTATTLLVV